MGIVCGFHRIYEAGEMSRCAQLSTLKVAVLRMLSVHSLVVVLGVCCFRRVSRVKYAKSMER